MQVLVISHQDPCRALRAYFMNQESPLSLHASNSTGYAALADSSWQVLELKMSDSNYECVEKIHTLGA